MKKGVEDIAGEERSRKVVENAFLCHIGRVKDRIKLWEEEDWWGDGDRQVPSINLLPDRSNKAVEASRPSLR